jgi:tetratricopeptide (TPR) repeat protein
MKVRQIFVILFIAVSLFSANANASTAMFYKGLRAVRSGQLDAAFMRFRSFLQSYPKSKLAPDTIFALGEYYNFTNNPKMAAVYFTRFLHQYPEHQAKIFACAYLLDMAKMSKRPEAVEFLEREIVTTYNLSLVFSKYKQYTYKSPFNKKYKALYYMDSVQMYVNDDLFTKISY